MATTLMEGNQNLQKLFETLETEKNLLTSCTDLWRKVANHFSSLERDLNLKSQTLDSKLQTLETTTKETLGSLDRRESSIPAIESASLDRIEKLKEAAFSDFANVNKGELPEKLRSFCRRMDLDGLLRFLISQRKDLAALKAEISHALSECVDPIGFVLRIMEGFVHESLGKIGASDMRWACGMALRALSPAMALIESNGGFKLGFPANVREKAWAIAEVWMERIDEDSNPAEVQMFLQFIASFGIGSRIEGKELNDLVITFSHRRDMPKTAIALGFGDKMEGIIEELISKGKEIDAVYFALESGLTERFAPIPLIKAYLKNSRRNAQAISKNGNNSASTPEESNALELNALRSVIKCIEDNKLEHEFPIENLKKRVIELEKAKASRRKTANRPNPKRSRASTGGSSALPSGRPAKAGRHTNSSRFVGGRNQSPVASLAHYQAPMGVPMGQPVHHQSPMGSTMIHAVGAHHQGATASAMVHGVGAQHQGPTALTAGYGYDVSLGQGAHGPRSPASLVQKYGGYASTTEDAASAPGVRGGVSYGTGVPYGAEYGSGAGNPMGGYSSVSYM
ncbi:hypothetical protein AMTRI_Chr05g64790 [Amborella trichopoda]|uniref:FRIGIDA-like protein n=1 Tax=Amborella trichopoda TaxID=13333 RepID=W1P8H4_AMBTC|nr:FRIGIDA-like protein 4a [Amborella trichopoda]ERN03911.1 hypothetical protein AMTR_s00078p00186900 [Amborella trichopoda]|eukprot:XP_006842236.1 FRIGIDA-like protein 4a [Amborella trichopoda]